MNHSDIEHMAQGFPPSSIGKDHEEVVTVLATSLLAAQQKLDALAAENAALLDFDIDEFRESGPYQHDDLILNSLKTPATDAYLNAIRAEGIIMFASKELAAAGDLDSTITIERLMLDAEEFAGQLHGSAGKDGEQ